MKKYDQLVQVHDPENGQIGDCFRASIACVLGIPPAHVPHFVEQRFHPEQINLIDIVNDINDWLLDVRPGLQYFEVKLLNEQLSVLNNVGYHIITGESIRSTKGRPLYHSIVGLNGEPFHDPHLSRAMLKNKLEYGLFIKRLL